MKFEKIRIRFVPGFCTKLLFLQCLRKYFSLRGEMMIFKIITAALLTVGFWMHGAYADRLYTWTDDKGVIHITKQPPPQKTKADNVIDYTPQTAEQIQAIQQDAERQQKRYDEKRKLDHEKNARNTKAETVETQEPDVYYQYDGGRYTRRARQYERRQEIERRRENQRSEEQLPVRRHREPRIIRHRR